MLASTQLQHYKARLISMRDELEASREESDQAAKPVELDQTLMGRLSRMDAMQGQAMALAHQRRKKLQLHRIALALTRLDKGEFGYCMKCDEDIDPRRLDFDPSTPLCLDCASRNEK